MITKAEGDKYKIAGIPRMVSEGPVFKPDNGESGYAIFDGTIPKNINETSVRFTIEAGRSSRPMTLVDNEYQGIRAVSRGSGYFLMVLSEKQLICLTVNEGDNISVGIGNNCTDCMIAKKDGPGLEVIEFGGPPFKPSMEKQVIPGSPEVPPEFFEIKNLLEIGNETEAFKILGKYQSQLTHGY